MSLAGQFLPQLGRNVMRSPMRLSSMMRVACVATSSSAVPSIAPTSAVVPRRRKTGKWANVCLTTPELEATGRRFPPRRGPYVMNKKGDPRPSYILMEMLRQRGPLTRLQMYDSFTYYRDHFKSKTYMKGLLQKLVSLEKVQVMRAYPPKEEQLQDAAKKIKRKHRLPFRYRLDLKARKRLETHPIDGLQEIVEASTAQEMQTIKTE